MQRRNFRLLFLGTIAIIVVAFVMLRGGDRAASPPLAGERALPGLADKLGDLAWLRITRGAMTANFAIIGGRWTMVEKGNYPAAQDRIRQLLLGLAELTLVEPKTDQLDLLSRLDLDDPANGKSTLVALQNRIGESVAQLIIGRQRPREIGGGAPGVYVRKPGTDQAWLARGSFDLAGDSLSWLDRHIVDIPANRVMSVVLTTADGVALVISRTSADQPFAVEGLPDDVHPKNDAVVAAPAAALAALDLDDVKPAAELPIPLEGAATAAFTTFDGLIIGLRLAPPGDTDWVAIDVTGFGQDEAAAKTLVARLSRWSFAIPAAKAKLLRTILSDLVQPRGS
jgi:hypothetical protein